MAQYLRPCISLPSWGPWNYGFYGPASYPSQRNPEFFSAAATPWVRIWIRWDHLQPNAAGTNPFYDSSPIDGWPGMTPQIYLNHKTLEIQAARAAGKKIMLVLHTTPTWANGPTRDLGPKVGPKQDYDAPPWDVSPDLA